ncbi:MAG TPA: hypothetical protein VLA95_08345 [Gemmatimonadales bacterium]|nr:hypothetical protein [Gemmatimonadales bacterium]
MSSLMDRLQRELEQLGKNAQEALEEGKVRVRVLRLERQRDNAARDLGMLTWRKERGGDVDARRIESLLFRLDDLEAEIARARTEASATPEPTGDVPAPAPPPAPPPPTW